MFSPPLKRMPKRKPAAVAPAAAAAAAEPALLMPNAANLHAAAPIRNSWHPNTGFRPTMSKEEAALSAARRAATIHEFTQRSNARAPAPAAAAIAAGPAGGAGHGGPSPAALMSNMPATPMRARPVLKMSNNGNANGSAAPSRHLHPLHEHVKLHRNNTAAAGKSPRRASRKSRRTGNNSRKNRRT